MGVLWSTLGFTTRAISTKHQQSSGLALTSTIFTLLAPLWFNAHAYITFSHLLHTFHPSRRILNLSPRVLSTLFVSLDIGTFVIQIVGGSSASPASPPEDQKKGVDIYMGGIGIQQFFIVIFVLLAIKFQFEMSHFVKIGKVENWNKGKRLLWAIYACVGFITVRLSPFPIYLYLGIQLTCEIDTHPLPPNPIQRRHFLRQCTRRPRSLLLRLRSSSYAFRRPDLHFYPPRRNRGKGCSWCWQFGERVLLLL